MTPSALPRRWEVSAGPWPLGAELTLVGGDRLVVVSGGERPHLGAWGRSLAGDRVGPEDFPGHRDAVVVSIFLDALAPLGGNWVVLAGIHVGNAARADVEALVGACRRLAETMAADLAAYQENP